MSHDAPREVGAPAWREKMELGRASITIGIRRLRQCRWLDEEIQQMIGGCLTKIDQDQ